MSTLESLYTVEAHEEGADCPIVDPRSGILHGLVITVVGEDSDTYRQADYDLLKSRIANKSKEISPTEAFEEMVEKFVKCTKGWYGPPGTEEFSRSAVRKLYRNSPPVLAQVKQFVEDRSEFYRD